MEALHMDQQGMVEVKGEAHNMQVYKVAPL